MQEIRSAMRLGWLLKLTLSLLWTRIRLIMPSMRLEAAEKRFEMLHQASQKARSEFNGCTVIGFNGGEVVYLNMSYGECSYSHLSCWCSVILQFG